MKKIAKYCAECQSKYAAVGGFCPDCGGRMSNFETNHFIIPEADYRPTIVSEKNSRQRNLLVLGAMVLMTTLAGGGMVYSIFNKALTLEAIETENLMTFVGEVDPLTTDPAEMLEPSRKKDGGGGGGRGDKNPTQKGVDATQVKDPMFSPSKDYVKVTDPEIKIRAATKGTKETPVSSEPYGLKKGGLLPSDGEGCCGGQGNSNTGRGQGVGPGDGLGPGKYGGSGGGDTGPDGGRILETAEPPKVRVGPTQALVILTKPRATYTDLARQNAVQGTVVLKVTFLASGQIGGIVPVAGLPNGLTEQAIAAARGIKFVPAKINGTAVAVVKTIEYSFTIF